MSMWIGSGRDECRRGRDMRIIDACDDHAPEFQALHSVHGAHGHPVRRMLFSVTGAPHMPIEELEGFGDVAELDPVVADPQLANTPSTSFR
ncbi:hypothetical protein [Nocardia niigatensis]